jgi:DedD protein
MPSDPKQPDVLVRPAKSPNGRRLIIAAALIGVSILVLALVNHLPGVPAGTGTAPHEPAQTLITTPVPGSETPMTQPEPEPPKILNNETLVVSPRASGPAPHAGALPAAPVRTYIVQVGVFNSPANAQALQKQLQRAGIRTHLETRVQMGPFRNKHDADRAIARAKKLGIDAVVVGSR